MQERLGTRLHTVASALALLAASAGAAAAQVGDEPVPRVGSVEIVGLDSVVAPDRLPPLPLRPGTPYSLQRLLAAEYRISRALAERGHASAVIESSATIPPGTRLADVRFEVHPGPVMVFDTVFVEAESPLADAEVRRRLGIRAGDPVSPGALERGLERVRRLPIVAEVQAGASPVPGQETRLATRVVISTHPAQGPGLSGTFSSARCLQGTVGWGSRYFLGAPRTFSVSAGGANLLARQLRRFPCSGVGEGEVADLDYFVRTQLGQPLGPTTWLFLSGELSRITAARAYVRRGVLGRIALSHELGTGWTAVAGYAPEHSDNPGAAPLLCAIYAICAAADIADATAATLHAPLELSLGWSTPAVTGVVGAFPAAPLWMQPFRRPWRLAIRGTVNVAAPATLSRFTYASALIDASGARSLSPRVEIVGRIGAGLLGNDSRRLPPQVRLFGGGPAGVRGLAPNLLGAKILTIGREAAAGRGLLENATSEEPLDPRDVRVRPTGGESRFEASLELRVRTFDWLELATFTDYGTVGSSVADFWTGAGSRSESVVTPGFGALVHLPIGPIRVDLAYDPSPARRYPLLVPGVDGSQEVLGLAVWNPAGFGDPSRTRELRRRIQLQLSVGHPF